MHSLSTVKGVDEAAFSAFLDWLAIPSVSADPGHARDVARAGEWICDQLRGVPGCEVEQRDLPGARHPSVIGQIHASGDTSSAPTVAVYCHFDVQPAGKSADWTGEPFAPEIRDGWLYARGASDSKTNCFIVLEAIKRLAGAGALPVNVDLMMDSEEEIDGIAIPDYAESRPDPDVAFVCDGSLWDDTTPCFWVSARGTLYYRLSLRTAERELHSGSFGGAALNAAGALIECLHAATRASLGSPQADSAPAAKSLYDGAEILERAGATPADANAAEEFYERTVLRSAVDVNSIGAGEVGLQKTAIPDTANANVSVRVAPGDDHIALDCEFRGRLARHAPDGAELSVDNLATVAPAQTDPDHEAMQLAAVAVERVYGKVPAIVGSGGTLPIFSTYAARGVPVALTGFASPDGAAHAADECFPLANLPVGIEAACELLRSFARLRSRA